MNVAIGRLPVILCALLLVSDLALAQRGRFQRPEIEPGTDLRLYSEWEPSVFRPLDLPAPNERRLASGAPGPDYWQQQVDYVINAELDEPSRRLEASMKITYHNNSPHDLTYLWMQLEQNLFREDSIGTQVRRGGLMRASGGVHTDGHDVHRVRSASGDMPFAIYDTLMRVELPNAIRAGEKFTFEVDFGFEMPPYLRRMGSEEVGDGTIYEYAQWYPHVCTYDDVHGWNTLDYLGTGEFYTNYGDYEVNLTVPWDHIVAATGMLQNPSQVLTRDQRETLERAMGSDEPMVIYSHDMIGDSKARPKSQGKLTWRFKAENVRTFAWATSRTFAWDACAATINDTQGRERRVLCQSVYPREAAPWWAPDVEHQGKPGGSSRYIKHAIEFYSDFLYPYPYPQMTNVNGPEGGMEYPMLVMCGGRRGDGPFGVTDHEVGHTWFPMIVNTDERRHIWMDEGFNSFINMYSRAAYSGEDVRPGRSLGQTLGLAMNPESQPIATAPDQMDPSSVGSLGYRKTAHGLYLLREHILGPERFDAAFRGYVDRWVFKSPQPADFFRSMEDGAGVDLAWFWRSWFLEPRILDQAITRVEERDGAVAVTFENRGDMVMPVDYLVRYEDGSEEMRRLPVEAWYSTNERTVAWQPNKRVVEITLDPNGAYPDVVDENDAWSAGASDSDPTDSNRGASNGG